MNPTDRSKRLLAALAAYAPRYVGHGRGDDFPPPSDIESRLAILSLRAGSRFSGNRHEHDLFILLGDGEAAAVSQALDEQGIEHQTCAVRLPISVDGAYYYYSGDAALVDERQPDLDDKIEALRLAEQPRLLRHVLDRYAALGQEAVTLEPEFRDLALESAKTGVAALQHRKNGHNDFRSRVTRAASLFVSAAPFALPRDTGPVERDSASDSPTRLPRAR